MHEFITKIKNKWFHPASQEDLDLAAANYRENQLVRIKTYAIGKGMEPSVVQSNLLHACMQLVADNHKKYDTLEKVKFQVKVALHFIYEDRIAVRPDGGVQFAYRSFSFAELRNMERLNIFDRAFDYLASMIGVSVEDMIKEAQSRMGRRN